MNLHTFRDVVNDKKSSLVNDLDEGDEEKDVGVLRKPVEGEEEEGADKFNEAGEVLEPFNLRDERDSGHFDENMNFVFQKEKGEIDAWLADMDEAAMEQGIGEAAKALRSRQEKISEAEAAAGATVKKSAMDLKVELLKIMRPGENVVQTMRRLSGKSLTGGYKAKKRSPKIQNGDSTAPPAEIETEAQKLAHRVALEQFTDVVDELLSTGLSGIYDMSYEAIETSAVRWEYRGLDGIIHGPFIPQIIASWKSQGYFSGNSSVMMRKVGIVGRDWTDVSVSGALGSSASASSSSEASVSITGKVRFNFGSDIAEQAPSKKMKSSPIDSSAQDLMNDLEDNDDDDSSSSIAGNVPEVIPAASRIEDEVRGQWTSSDDIDFDIYVEEKAENVDDADVDDDEDDI